MITPIFQTRLLLLSQDQYSHLRLPRSFDNPGHMETSNHFNSIRKIVFSVSSQATISNGFSFRFPRIKKKKKKKKNLLEKVKSVVGVLQRERGRGCKSTVYVNGRARSSETAVSGLPSFHFVEISSSSLFAYVSFPRAKLLRMNFFFLMFPPE